MSELPTVLCILPRGEAVRNMVYSGVLDKLKCNANLHLITVVPNTRIEALLREQDDAFIALKPIYEPYSVRLIRELLNTAHGRWLWSEATKHRWVKREAESVNIRQWLKLKIKRGIAYPFASPTGLTCLQHIERLAAEHTESCTTYVSLFRKLKPDLVFNSSHVHGATVRPLLAAAEKLGIETMAFLFSWDNLTTQGRIIPKYRSYIAWTHDIAQDLFRLYPSVDQRCVYVTGTPQFDFHFNDEYLWTREYFCQQLSLEASRPIVLYTTGMPNHMPYEDEIVEQLADILKLFPTTQQPQLLVRVYPKDHTGRFENLFTRRQDIRKAPVFWEQSYLTPLPEDTCWYLNCLHHCDVGINVASTVSLELCIHDRPVLNIAYDPPGRDIFPCSYQRFYHYDHYAAITRSGAVEVVWNSDHLFEAIKGALERPEDRRMARRSLIQERFGECLDGRCADRVATAILDRSRRAAMARMV